MYLASFEYHKDDMRSVVHKSYGQIKKNGVVRLFKSHKDGFKDGEQLRDFIYGVDAARACVEMLINGMAKNRAYITWAPARPEALRI